MAEADRPKGLLDLVDPRWKGKIAIAKPLFGTTATHATCLFAHWGDEKARAFFTTLNSANRYAILYRIQDAKRPETRARRIEQIVAMLNEGKTFH